MSRDSWDEYFMGIAVKVASRATCDRKHVGAVLVRDNQTLPTGYNGSIRKMPHCDDVGHLMENGHCVRTIHAEANAILQAARRGVAIDGATMYVTSSPCWGCFSLMANGGITRIVCKESYRIEDFGSKRVIETAAKIGIEYVALSEQNRDVGFRWFMCEHANECPRVCPCSAVCVCRSKGEMCEGLREHASR